MSVEHASMRIIDGYARGDTDIAADEIWALEGHLETCGLCRDRLTTAVGTEAPAVAALVDTVWADLEPQLAAVGTLRHRRRWSIRLSRWTTPVMAPWLAMVMLMTLLALLLDLTDPGFGDMSLLLLLAPVLSVGGVAASWSRGLDPAYELTAAAPRAGLYLVLRRTASVLTVVVPALLVGGWLTGVMVAQWLLPCLACTSMTLALGSVIGVNRAAIALVAGWGAMVVMPSLAVSRMTLVLQPEALPGWAVILGLGVGVVIARRSAYSRLGTHR
ncbi:hypothetical protein [Actinoalloteichus hymeniacidonis]|uniref:Integral membrane protein n=1 Tax=Actinoalloteichus hymeniacidonis TaxID=340345 RepID=A0AAC9HV96_9PSEU|nr:hypothetical protein [Actinoalloteichus hymeniacidonis]AOS65646.1 hypothetical protein TL08_24340 [Actinoalloteichus hymeniacidonis]MBB5906264.1 hypothetical protein [Actinoalloteichus hymeniacidonis]